MVAKPDPPLEVRIPPPDAPPGWTWVGVASALGLAAGLLVPKLFSWRIAPVVPSDARPFEVTATGSASAGASSSPAPAPAPLGSAQAVPAPAEALGAQRVTVSAGKVLRCADGKEKKTDGCGEIAFDPIAKAKFATLTKCPAALGLDAKLTVQVEVQFDKGEISLGRAKKSSVPGSTVQGILQCASKEFAGVALKDIAHEHKRYTLQYALTFEPAGKEGPAADDTKPDDSDSGSAPSKGEAGGTATVSQDTALVRAQPKDGKVAFRLVRGTRVKLLAKDNDWYRVQHGTREGWVYRGALGL